MNNHEINMYVAKFRKQMTFATKKQEYNFKTKINGYSTKDAFNLTYELFKLCIEKDKQVEELKAENEELKCFRDHFRNSYEDEKRKNQELQEGEKQVENLADEIVKADGCVGNNSHPLESLVNEMDMWKQKSVELGLENEKLKEELEEQKNLTKRFCERSQKKSIVITKTLDAIVNTGRIKKGTNAMSMIKSIHAHDELYNIVSYNLTALQEEIKKLKIDHSMNLQYWRCYGSYVDPSCDCMPDKEHIDKWCKHGDHEDWKLKEYLYDQFCIDEDEEDDE